MIDPPDRDLLAHTSSVHDLLAQDLLAPDPRLMAVRPDLAAEALRGKVAATRFTEARPRRIILPAVALRKAPEAGRALETELIFGEVFDVYEFRGGWAWGQAKRDGYVGYVEERALSSALPATTHRVTALRGFLYPGPGIKTTPLGFLPFGAEVAVEGTEGGFSRLAEGYIFSGHLAPLDARETDPVAVAETFLGIPYLWGGKSSLGLDCSALVQTACHACGIPAPRDSDMQEKVLGERVEILNDPAHYRRGDLLFWPGHVAMARGDGTMIHATAFSMNVIIEPLAEALARIEAQGTPLRTARRLTFG